MQVPLGDTITPRFFVNDPATGGLSAADSTPTVNVTEDGGTAFTTGVTVNSVTDTVAAGEYEAVIVCSGANGYEQGKWYEVAGYATVDGTQSGFSICRFQVIAAQSVEGVPEVDVTHWIGTAAATPTTAGVPEVDLVLWRGAEPSALSSGLVQSLIIGLNAGVVSTIQSGLATAAALAVVDDFLDTEVAAILAAVDTEVSSIKTTVEALPSAAANATAVLAGEIHTGYSVARALRIIGGAVAGKATGAANNQTVFRFMDDSGDALTTVSDDDGNRSTATHGA